jgi:hypothetical protein
MPPAYQISKLCMPLKSNHADENTFTLKFVRKRVNTILDMQVARKDKYKKDGRISFQKICQDFTSLLFHCGRMNRTIVQYFT